MDFIMYVLEARDHFLSVVLIKPECSSYFKLNSTLVEGRVKECDLDQCLHLTSPQETGSRVGVRAVTSQNSSRVRPGLNLYVSFNSSCCFSDDLSSVEYSLSNSGRHVSSDGKPWIIYAVFISEFTSYHNQLRLFGFIKNSIFSFGKAFIWGKFKLPVLESSKLVSGLQYYSWLRNRKENQGDFSLLTVHFFFLFNSSKDMN